MTLHPATRGPRASRLAAAVLGAALLVTACSSDSDPTSSSGSATTVSAPAASSEPTDTSSTTAPDDTTADTTAPDDTAASADDIVANPPAKTWLEAVAAAKEEFDGDLVEVELERHGSDRFEYTVVLVSEDTEFEIELDGDTLEIRSTDTDDLGDDAAKMRARIFDPDDVIDLEEAAAIARGEVDGTIDEWELEGKDDGRIEYEFEIIPTGATDDIEVEIDARTGEVLDVD